MDGRRPQPVEDGRLGDRLGANRALAMIEGKRSAEDFAKGALDKTNSHPTRRAEAAMAAGAHPTCGADGRIDEIADPPQPCRPPCRDVPRSEERRVGKECVSTCRSRGSQ